MNSGKPTQELVKFVTDLDYSDLTLEIVQKTKLLLIDQIGCELGGSMLSPMQIVYRYIVDNGAGGKCTLANYGLRTTGELASFGNGCFGHAFDIDDIVSFGHPGSMVIPALLATSQICEVSGKDFVTSMVAAYEVFARIVASISPSALLDRGFHSPTSVSGVFGSAAAVGKVLNLSVEQLEYSFGIAGSHASGLSEFTLSGSEVKRLHAGLGAMGGLRSSFLARNGFTGPKGILEGKKGFCQAFANKYDLDRLTDRLGERWFILDTGIKPYGCAQGMHPLITAIEDIYKEEEFSIDEINEVRAGTISVVLGHGGGQMGDEPKDIMGMQYSTQFGIAVALVLRDNAFKGYAESSLKNEKLYRLSKKVKLSLDPEAEEEYLQEARKNGRLKAKGRVTIILNNGRKIEKQAYGKGSIENPMAEDEIYQKFRVLASRSLDKNQVNEIQSVVNSIESSTDISNLPHLLAK